MSNTYKTHSTSKSSAVVGDKILSETSLTRKVIRPMILDNRNNSEASVKITILHQKAIRKNEFEDISEQPLTSLKAKEIVKLSLDSAETKVLYDQLKNLYLIHQQKGVPLGDNNLVVAREEAIVLTDPRRAGLIKNLIAKGYSKEVWDQLLESDPDLATKLSLARIQQSRGMALKKFEEMLGQNLPETEWQKFFEQNTWIFGYGLNYQILKPVQNQPLYGGQGVSGKGSNKGDFLVATQGNARFSVLVEIKKPSTDLLDKKTYRNDVVLPGLDLIGGVSQLRVNARTWETDGSRSTKNQDTVEGAGIFTVKPKTILVVGNTNQLANRAQRECFELFRQGQNDVEILTFDELYERAKFIVEHEEVEQDEETFDDFPFD